MERPGPRGENSLKLECQAGRAEGVLLTCQIKMCFLAPDAVGMRQCQTALAPFSAEAKTKEFHIHRRSDKPRYKTTNEYMEKVFLGPCAHFLAAFFCVVVCCQDVLCSVSISGQ